VTPELCAGAGTISSTLKKNVANKVFKIEQTPNLKKMFEKGEPAGEANTVNAPNWVRGKEFSWLKSYVGVPIRVREKVVGFLNVDSAAPDSYTPQQMQALQALAGSVAAAIENAQLFKQVQEYSGELESALIDTTLALAKTLDVRDSFTANHSQVMAVRAQKIFRLLGGSERDVMLISLAAQLHDIGKIGVPDEILHKAAALSDGEWKIIWKHPEVGAEIVKRVKGLGEVADIVQAHQEHFDGNGYPRGLKGEEIPLAARIISVVDAYGAMTEDRAYRKALSRKEAYAELRRNSGSQFDPKVVDAFFQFMPED
jgi:putative nucleotidyltransferase with HDIG domain